MIRLGYVAQNLTLAKDGIKTSRQMIKKTFQNRGISLASELALKNLRDLKQILKWNAEQKIEVFRITSKLFPWESEYKLEDLPNFEDIKTLLEECGKLAEETNQRLTFHPDHFCKLAATKEEIYKNTVKNLEHHSKVFDLMGFEPSVFNLINIHIGAVYESKDETIKRFAERYHKLSDNLKKRLTVENDDKKALYTVEDLYKLHELTGIPIVFDYLHHSLVPGTLSEEEALLLTKKTWPTDIRQLVHYADSRKLEDPKCKFKHAHADYVYNKINDYGLDLDIDLESKAKDLALLKYREDFGYEIK